MRDLAEMLQRADRLRELARARARPRPRAIRVRDCFRLEAVTGGTARMIIHGIIGEDFWSEDGGNSSGRIAAELADLDADVIDLSLNSPGGVSSDGIAIYQALVEHPARVVVNVDGMAASAASVIAMAGDEIAIAKPARMMIHDAWSFAAGNAGELREVAELLDGLSQDMAEVYADRAGGDAGEWRTAMLATTWYSSAQAVEAGLAHRVKDAGRKPADSESSAEALRSQLIRARARANRLITVEG